MTRPSRLKSTRLVMGASVFNERRTFARSSALTTANSADASPLSPIRLQNVNASSSGRPVRSFAFTMTVSQPLAIAIPGAPVEPGV